LADAKSIIRGRRRGFILPDDRSESSGDTAFFGVGKAEVDFGGNVVFDAIGKVEFQRITAGETSEDGSFGAYCCQGAGEYDQLLWAW